MTKHGLNKPIFITGAPRSGKTLVAGILDICGVQSGYTDKMLENMAIRDKMLASLLMFHGGDPAGLNPIIDTADFHIPNNWKEKTESYLTKQGVDIERSWMIKSAKIALTWPVWRYHYPHAKFVIVRRRTGDIIQSCMKTGYMRAFEEAEGWKSMVHEYEKIFVQMINEGVNCKVIWPDRMVDGDYSQIYEMLEWLGLPWKTEILPFIDPKFWKLRRKEA